MEEQKLNCTPKEGEILSRRIRIVKDHLDDDIDTDIQITADDDDYLAGENDSSPNPYREP